MYSRATRLRALNLIEQGQTLRSISMLMRISRATLRDWRDHPENVPGITCPRCEVPPTLPDTQTEYAYLLGLYLGDGCLSRVGDRNKNVWVLRVMCADAWPGLLDECKRAMLAVHPDNAVGVQQREGCSEVRSCSKHWPCLFPQHGPGRKHDRLITLESWQHTIVTEHTGEFIRGLFHSDGCRITNRVRQKLTGEGRVYEYPRYLFVNHSTDILRLCGEALDRLGVAWRFSKPTTISVARREAVARLDLFVGPKY
ncbi:MAG TPA: helix-turn-helix domain-containing protein [Streptosporangiaceae bacterium]